MEVPCKYENPNVVLKIPYPLEENNSPFLANFPILYPDKTPENLCFLVFSGAIK